MTNGFYKSGPGIGHSAWWKKQKPKIPPAPPLYILTDRSTGTQYALMTDSASAPTTIVLTDPIPANIRGRALYGAWDGPILAGQPPARVYVTGGALRIEEFVPLGNSNLRAPIQAQGRVLAIGGPSPLQALEVILPAGWGHGSAPQAPSTRKIDLRTDTVI